MKSHISSAHYGPKTHYDDIDGFCTKTEVPEIELELSSLLHNTEGAPRSPEVDSFKKSMSRIKTPNPYTSSFTYRIHLAVAVSPAEPLPNNARSGAAAPLHPVGAWPLWLQLVVSKPMHLE